MGWIWTGEPKTERYGNRAKGWLPGLIPTGGVEVDFHELAEIELNPVRVLPVGEGAFAVDVRARVGS